MEFDSRIAAAREKLLRLLERLRNDDHHWTGKLSTSALSTATAVSALSICLRQAEHAPVNETSHGRWRELVARGSRWLLDSQNDDGGFGDTELSHSNIATTLLVLSALRLAEKDNDHPELVRRAWDYVEAKGKWSGLKARYGKDKTFVVPILANCALAGLADWKQVSPLPFEAAALPQSWYRFARMPVVSYAVPALVAIGQAQNHFAPSRIPFLKNLRSLFIPRTLRVLHKMQPESGGYLEAVPLTSFVLMSLAAMGHHELPVTKNCIKFLEDSVLDDGSWPIDTNLATWVTSLTTRAISGLTSMQVDEQELAQRLVSQETIEWLLGCQYQVRHPFTGADPGGWGWTNLTGSVPDADDTPAAIIAISEWKAFQLRNGMLVDGNIEKRIAKGIEQGCEWLLGLQNRDGGWPTFCRGWGKLPFDRSGSDLTAHALRALKRSEAVDHGKRSPRKAAAILKGLKYLAKHQRPDGSWLPLWFGNQDEALEENPIYGTSRVLLALQEFSEESFSTVVPISEMIRRGVSYLAKCQNSEGGWGGGSSVRYEKISGKPSHFEGSAESPGTNAYESNSNFHTPNIAQGGVSGETGPETAVQVGGNRQGQPIVSTVEETALALEALLACDTQAARSGFIMAGLNWLCKAIEEDWHRTSWPIGFYFAKLWYHEQMYPIVYSLAALQKYKAMPKNGPTHGMED